VFVVLTPLQGIVFIAVHQAWFGVYLGSSFAPNHKGMPVLSEDSKLDYLRRQVLTSRNVRGGWLVDTALGGLNYQIEHHFSRACPAPTCAALRPWCQASATNTASHTAKPRSFGRGAKSSATEPAPL
jgi:hypothetical protein